MRKSAILVAAMLVASVFGSAYAQQEHASQAGITSIQVSQYQQGLYYLNVEFSETFPDMILLDPNNYHLRKVSTGEAVRLPDPVLWISRPGKGVKFVGIEITYDSAYVLTFRDSERRFDASDFDELEEGQRSYEEFEQGGKRLFWQRSFKPKIIQSDSTAGDIADLGFDLMVRHELPQRFELSFDASVTSNKEDPINHLRLNLYWRPAIWMPSPRVGLRPLTLCVQEDANQTLEFHDLSGRAFTTLFVHPFNGIQPIFMTAGIDEALRISRDGDDFDEPRAHFQVQWGMVGLVGADSKFFIDWRYLRVLDDLGDPKLDPTICKERSYVEIGLVMPLYGDKNLTVTYADGDIAPMYTRNTSIQLGLEILFGGERVLGPR